MNTVLGQLYRWRLTERLIRLVWGAGRFFAIVGVVLALACFTDWLADRYLGSEGWHKFLKATRVFAPKPTPTAEERWFTEHLRIHNGVRIPVAPVVDETPKWLRVVITCGQALLAAWLLYTFLIRPWSRTPPIDDLASTAEKEIPEFGHRLVTAVQLNRPTARTQGMSQVLIKQLTKEAGNLVAKHNLLSLVNYSRIILAAAVVLPVLALWGVFAFARPELATVLLKRQMLLDVEIPRTIQLENISQEVWPTGSEAEVRYKVTGEYDPSTKGRLRVQPDGQPEDYYDLEYANDAEGGGAIYRAKLPPSSSDFDFTARLGNGRTREVGRIRFEAPPNTTKIEATQVLPDFLGKTPQGQPYLKQVAGTGAERGEMVDALPMSRIVIDATFSKPIQEARLFVIERAEGIQEKESQPYTPVDFAADRKSASWLFPTTSRTIGYRIELTDYRGFHNAVPIRRNIRMLEDRPPFVTFMPESIRHPDPTNKWEGNVNDKARYELGDKMPLTLDGRVMVVFHAQSEQGISRANVRYRVVPKGVDFASYPKEIQDIQHPRQDPENKVYAKLPLKPVTADLSVVGKFVPDLGLFEKSWNGLDEQACDRVNVEFYSVPSTDPNALPHGLEAGGRYNFEVAGLVKTLTDGTTAKLELGDTVELFVEVFDKNPTPGRPPGYTREARRKIIVSAKDAEDALTMWKEQGKRLQQKLDELTADQKKVFKKPDEEEPTPPENK